MTIGYSYRAPDVPSVDPEVAAVYSQLRDTLARMGTSIEHASQRLADNGAQSALYFRAGPRLQGELARFMAQTGITNQAAALRLLLRLGLEAAAGRL